MAHGLLGDIIQLEKRIQAEVAAEQALASVCQTWRMQGYATY